MEKHITLAGAFNLALGIIGILAVIAISVVMSIVGSMADDPDVAGIMAVLMTGILLLLTLVSIAQIIGGIGLIKKQSWSRVLMIVVSAIRLIDVPLGTALGVYTIWVLIQEETKRILEPHAVHSMQP